MLLNLHPVIDREIVVRTGSVSTISLTMACLPVIYNVSNPA